MSSAFTIRQMSPQLLVADLERAIQFYTDNLGFEVAFRYEDFYAGIVKDGFSIHLKISENPEANKKQQDDLDITFSVENIEAIYAELSAKLVTIIQPLRQMPYGYEFYMADADGNVIAFFENIE
jgi:predicted enzyme related to lactoylglutathione lyase